ncbi:MAG: hypothetical protein AB1898_28880 [Acidobacteriota bacterium]
MVLSRPLLLVAAYLLWGGTPLEAQSDRPRPVDRQSTGDIYLPGGSERLSSLSTVSKQQRLADERNYELTTTFRVPSINGGEVIDREVSEKSWEINGHTFKRERVVRSQDSSGRLTTSEVVSEDHTLKGNVEEIQRSFFRPDLNGKLVPQSVENETITKVSPSETQTSHAIYRPSPDGEFALAELVESTERRLNSTTTVMESQRQAQEPSSRMALVEKVREITTKSGEGAFKKERQVHRADDHGRLILTDKVFETQSQSADGTRKYQRVLESRNLTPLTRNAEGGLVISERVTGEERKLADGSIESALRVETIDPVNAADGLKTTQIVTETSHPLPNGQFRIERTVKSRDVNGNYVVSQRISEVVSAKTN